MTHKQDTQIDMLRTPAQPGKSASPARESDGVDGSSGKTQRTSYAQAMSVPSHSTGSSAHRNIDASGPLLLLPQSVPQCFCMAPPRPGRQVSLNTIHHCAGRVHNGAVKKRAGFATETSGQALVLSASNRISMHSIDRLIAPDFALTETLLLMHR